MRSPLGHPQVVVVVMLLKHTTLGRVVHTGGYAMLEIKCAMLNQRVFNSRSLHIFDTKKITTYVVHYYFLWHIVVVHKYVNLKKIL